MSGKEKLAAVDDTTSINKMCTLREYAKECVIAVSRSSPPDVFTGSMTGRDETSSVQRSGPITSFRFCDQESRKWDSELSIDDAKNSNLQQMRQATLVRRIEAGRVDDLSIEHVHQIFDMFNIEDRINGTLNQEQVDHVLQKLLQPSLTESEAAVFWEFSDTDGDGRLSAEEFHNAIKAGPFKAHLVVLQGRYEDFKQKRDANILRSQLERNFMYDAIKARVQKEDAFASLPLTFLSAICFMGLVWSHLCIENRYRTASALRDRIADYGTTLDGPYFDEHIDNVPNMWSWMSLSGIAAVLGDCKTNDQKQLHCLIASRHTLLGDVRVEKVSEDGEEDAVWLLHTDTALKYLGNHANDYLGAARAELNRLWANGWADKSVSLLALTFVTYNGNVRIFTKTQAKAMFDTDGVAVPILIARSSLVDPYANPTHLILVDILYFLQLVIPMFGEFKGLVRSIKHAGVRSGISQYFDLWNAVDWINFAGGIASALIWVICCQAASDAALKDLLTDNLSAVSKEIMSVDIVPIHNACTQLESIEQSFLLLHFFLGICTFCIIMKLFKAFEANARMCVVTRTMSLAAVDIWHFLIVFSVVFLAYGVYGHITFYSTSTAFESLLASFNTNFCLLMGIFDWYSEVMESPSTPFLWRMALACFFWSYNIIVLLIMLNMLMAIVLDIYVAVNEEILKGHASETLCQQAFRWKNDTIQTWNFVPLEGVLGQLENGAHADTKVTPESMSAAFPKMKKKQVNYLMDWLGMESVYANMVSKHEALMKIGRDTDNTVSTLVSECGCVRQQVEQLSHHVRVLEDAGYIPHLEHPDEKVNFEEGVEDEQLVREELVAQSESLVRLAKAIDDLNASLDQNSKRNCDAPLTFRAVACDMSAVKNAVQGLADLSNDIQVKTQLSTEDEILMAR